MTRVTHLKLSSGPRVSNAGFGLVSQNSCSSFESVYTRDSGVQSFYWPRFCVCGCGVLGRLSSQFKYHGLARREFVLVKGYATWEAKKVRSFH